MVGGRGNSQTNYRSLQTNSFVFQFLTFQVPLCKTFNNSKLPYYPNASIKHLVSKLTCKYYLSKLTNKMSFEKTYLSAYVYQELILSISFAEQTDLQIFC